MANRNDTKIFGQSINLLIGLLVLLIFFIGLFWITSAILRLLYSWIAPVILIVALIIDYKVLIEYIQMLVKLLKKNTGLGIAAIIGSVIGYPFVFSYLLAKAYYRKKQKKSKSSEPLKEGEYIDFEELESKSVDIPEIRKESDDSTYDNVFEK